MTALSATREAQAAFESAFLSVLRSQVHTDYERDTRIKGHFVEFRRQTPEGLYLSYNLQRVQLNYDLNFAVLLAPHPPVTPLFSPFVFGARFQSIQGLWRQYFEHLGLKRGDPGYPPYLWSGGTPRSNTIDIISRSIAAPEGQLYPRYADAIRRGKHRIVALLKEAHALLGRVSILGLTASEAPQHLNALGIDAEAFARFAPLLGRAGGLELAHGGTLWAGFGPSANTVNLDEVPTNVIALFFLNAFSAITAPLPELIKRVQGF